jgi:hypothetical protein
MRKTLTLALALVAMAAAFAAVAAGGARPAGQRVRIEVKGTDPYTFVLKPVSHGQVQTDLGSATFCCWTNWSVTRAGTKLDVSNPQLTISGERGMLKIREQIVWVDLPDGWQVCTGTWKVVGGSRWYSHVSGHGRVACVWAPDTAPARSLRLRLFGFLAAK